MKFMMEVMVLYGNALVISPATASGSVGQRRADVRPVKFVLPGSLAIKDIAKTLHEDATVAEHVGELSDFLRIRGRPVERLPKVVRAENGEVGVLGLLLFIGMPVDYRKTRARATRAR